MSQDQGPRNGVENEPEPNSHLSDYGRLMRRRFTVADAHAEQVLPPSFATRFRSTMRELLDQNWDWFGAADSFIVNSQIPYVNDVVRWAYNMGLLADMDKPVVPDVDDLGEVSQ